ncbi:hypothetical protein K8I85_03335 [bacterium]|nr:hypothetical protein [bacterium]
MQHDGKARSGARRPTRRAPVALAALLAALLLPVSSGHALDGSVDVRQSDQHARTEETSFQTSWRRETVTARQSLRISSRVILEAAYRGTRERTTGDGIASQEIRQTTQAPDISLGFRTRPLSMGIKTGYLERTSTDDGDVISETTRRQITAWLNSRLSSGTRLSSNATRTISETTNSLDETNENRQTSGFALAEQPLGGSFFAQYRFSGLSGDVTRLGSSRDQTSHGLEFRGSPRSSDGRLASSFRVRSQLFDQRREADTGTGTIRFETPLSVGLVYDDTPETLDPLEGSVLPAPGLADGDRSTPTSINIGDSAPVVREFGGDYRNLQLDFGESQLFSSAALYVDTRLLQPQLFEWLVYVSDDPDGRLWTRVTQDQVEITYREWGALLQGWEVQFLGEVSGRYLKLVDVKFGTTVPDLFVTEMETFTRTATGRVSTDDRTLDHNLDASISYDATDQVRVGYQTSLRRRDERDSDGDLTGAAHTASVRWQDEGPWAALTRVDRHTLEGPTRASSDVLTFHVAASHGVGSHRSATVSFTTSRDRGGGRDQQTDTYGYQGEWRAAPRLHFSQRISHGRRTDHEFDILSRSVTLTHAMRSSPITTLTINLDRRDRWTSRALGSGFERFHDTELDVIWAPAPLVTVSSDLLVRERQDTDWSTRQSLTWSPLPGRKVETHISGSSFFDSRTRVQRLGVDVGTKWRPDRQFVVEASVGAQSYRVGDDRSTPINTFLRAGWTF